METTRSNYLRSPKKRIATTVTLAMSTRAFTGVIAFPVLVDDVLLGEAMPAVPAVAELLPVLLLTGTALNQVPATSFLALRPPKRSRRRTYSYFARYQSRPS